MPGAPTRRGQEEEEGQEEAKETGQDCQEVGGKVKGSNTS